MPVTDPFPVHLTVDPNLTFFTPRNAPTLERAIMERTSVKDIIESCGIPHTEVDLLVVNGRTVSFGEVLQNASDVLIFGVPAPADLHPETRLQVRHHTRFIADGHLGKLTRRLRLLGLDVIYDACAHDSQLVQTTATQDRALLTRDRRLLMHRAVRHGYYLRSQHPDEQVHEVVRRFELEQVISPFTRCLRCNAQLEEVRKADVLVALEPLTRRYYNHFRRCVGCRQVYWAGSHYPKLAAYVQRICGSPPVLV